MPKASTFDPPHYTYDDYKLWEGRWELIGGTAYAMSPAPSVAHQAVSNKIAWVLESLLQHCPDCRALLPVDWRISDDTVVQPDNLVVFHPVDGAYITRAPELVFEILSKSTAAKDEHTKFAIYEARGRGRALLCLGQRRRPRCQGVSSARRTLRQARRCGG